MTLPPLVIQAMRASLSVQMQCDSVISLSSSANLQAMLRKHASKPWTGAVFHAKGGCVCQSVLKSSGNGVCDKSNATYEVRGSSYETFSLTRYQGSCLCRAAKFTKSKNDQWNHAGGFSISIGAGLSLKMQPRNNWLNCRARCTGSEPRKCRWLLASGILRVRIWKG